MRILLLTFLFSLISNANALLLKVDYTSASEYRLTKRDSTLNTSEQSFKSVDPVRFEKNIYVDLSSAETSIERVSGNSSSFVQHSTVTNYTNFSFDLFAPFLETFVNNNVGGDILGINNFSLGWSYFDYNVYFNETDVSVSRGGEGKIRFGQLFNYKDIDPITGFGYEERLWLSGDIKLFRVSSLDEYNDYKNIDLSGALSNPLNGYSSWNVNFSKFDRVSCGLHCVGIGKEQNFFGRSIGFISSVSVPESNSLVTLILGLLVMFGFTRRFS